MRQYQDLEQGCREYGIAPSRVDEVFAARQYLTTERRIAQIVPQSLAQTASRRLTQDEKTGATIYAVPEEHLKNMRQVLSGTLAPPVPSVAVQKEVHWTTLPVEDILAGTLYSLPVPLKNRKDSMTVLAKIDEDKEPPGEASELEWEEDRGEPLKKEPATDANDGPKRMEDHNKTTPELSSASDSPASEPENSFSALFPEAGLGIRPSPPPQRG